ncbi:MAG TPA: lysophospholipid acyltransferase family protein [Candidatus Angelobacter sp.]|nr:lysophospholipid acyltransferase family protein [Candidatus Angelobacter sp.]
MTADAAISGPVRRPPIPAQPIYELTLGSPYRSAWRLAAFLVLVAGVSVAGGIALALKIRRLLNIIPMVYHRLCCWLLDIHIEIRGNMSTARPTLFVCNHTSYLDISVLGSIITGSFIAKAEVADWPVFGYLSRLQRTVFIDRQRRTTTHHQRDQLAQRLDEGDNLILFPEGTSNDGNRTLPFRSALFGVAERKGESGRAEPLPLAIQPVSLAYVRLNGMPIGRSLRPFLAWYGDMELLGHLWHVAGLGRITVAVEFHPPVTLAQFGSRKALSEHCQRAVAEGVAVAIAGRREAVEKAATASAKKYT